MASAGRVEAHDPGRAAMNARAALLVAAIGSQSGQDEAEQDSYKNGHVRHSGLYEPILGSERRCCRGPGGARSTRQQLRPALIRAEGERWYHPDEPSNDVADRNRCSLSGISAHFVFVGQNSCHLGRISDMERPVSSLL